MIDVNVTLGRSPFRRLPLDDSAELVRRLKSLGVTQAWAGSFEALLHEDVGGVNLRLAEACKPFADFLVPIGCVNPLLPDWEEELRRCAEDHKCPGIRLHPEFHGYESTDTRFVGLLDLATKAKLFVQICWRFEDERTVNRALKLGTWNMTHAPALIDAINRVPDLRVMVLNSQTDLRGAALTQLAKTGKTRVDIARQEGVTGVKLLADLVGFERVVFGSHSPFFIPEAASLKLTESGLSDQDLNAIRRGNVAQWMKD
jgi:predicted TIM-barrel fold metal-dependent hydrolase